MAEMVGQMDRLAGLGRMLMCVVHDMSSPLSYVQANVNTLAQDLAVPGAATDPAEVAELLGDVREGVRRIVDLVKRLREYATPAPPEPAVVPVSQVFEAAQRVVHPQFRHRIEVEVSRSAEDPLVRTQGRDVEQIVVNLLMRAAQAMDWRGHVRLAVVAGAESTAIEVTDRGPAIPADLVERMFDPFFTREGQGDASIGLAVSRDLARRCGGRLTGRPAGEVGNTFTLELPRVPAA
jgi:C4-dicarboxylate-specific signal transduction histidine kinase